MRLGRHDELKHRGPHALEPTPHLIGVDPTGDVVGVPAVLMTELPGRPEWAAGQRWMRQLVDVLVDVHEIDPGAAAGARPFAVYAQSSYALPKWATKPAVWERAIEIFHGPVLDDDRTFIHRDFYPGNVLWHRRTVSGLVDWEAASVGPRSMDVAHCRINLLYDGLDAADTFTRTWEPRTGRTFDRWADIATIVGLLDSERRPPSAHRKRDDIETMLQRAVNEIDGPYTSTERSRPQAHNTRLTGENSAENRRSVLRRPSPTRQSMGTQNVQLSAESTPSQNGTSAVG